MNKKHNSLILFLLLFYAQQFYHRFLPYAQTAGSETQHAVSN